MTRTENRQVKDESGDAMKRKMEKRKLTVLDLSRRSYMEAFESLRATGMTPASEAKEWLEHRALMVASFFAGEQYSEVISRAEPEELDHLLGAIEMVVGGIARHPDTWEILDGAFFTRDRLREANRLTVTPPETVERYDYAEEEESENDH